MLLMCNSNFFLAVAANLCTGLASVQVFMVSKFKTDLICWKNYFHLSHPQSTLGWGAFHRYRCWPQGSHTSLFCSDNRRQRVLHGGLCWVSGLQSRASWHCRRYDLFWCQLCRELDGKTEQLNKCFHQTLQIHSVDCNICIRLKLTWITTPKFAWKQCLMLRRVYCFSILTLQLLPACNAKKQSV